MQNLKLPSSFVARTQPLLGAEWPDFVAALCQNPPVSVRINDKLPLSYEQSVPWCPNGFYLPQRPSFTLDPLFHAGCYYVQEASSMFLWQALEQFVSKDSFVLDLCAAPGGKSTLISEYLKQDGFLVSNELIRSRAYILSENVQKWGNGNVLVCQNQPKDFGKIPAFFDVVVVDAPCSGEGMFRKDTGAVNEWSEDNVYMCADRQKTILSDVWDTLKPGGILIYSTCTYNREENENNVNWICQQLGATYESMRINPEWQVTDSGLGYHFYPHKTRGEGFFLSVLRKNDAAISSVRLKQDKRNTQKQNISKLNVQDWLLPVQDWEFVFSDTSIVAQLARFSEKINFLRSVLSCISWGVELACIKGKNTIPQQSLALSKYLNKEKFTTFDTDLDTALAFLRTEALLLNHLPLDYILVTYKSVPLGWVKQVGNRCNNLYPNEWRIRKNAN